MVLSCVSVQAMRRLDLLQWQAVLLRQSSPTSLVDDGVTNTVRCSATTLSCVYLAEQMFVDEMK